MALIFIKTNRNAFLIDTVDDPLRKRLGIVFGRAIHLYALKIVTQSNPDGSMSYSDYIDDTPVQVCHQKDVIEQRKPNSVELDIYNRIRQHQKLTKTDREYLRKYFFVKKNNSN